MLDVVCGILIAPTGQVLIAQRGPSQSSSGLWEFPGGKLEENESETDALVRELKEELGIAVTPIAKAGESVITSPKELRLTAFWCAPDPAATLLLREHQQAHWEWPANLESYTWCVPDIPLVHLVQQEARANPLHLLLNRAR